MEEKYMQIYAVVPTYIYKSKELSGEDKLIAERIIALCRKEGYAWITNKTLGDMYGIREDTVSRHIRNLKNIGFLNCIYDSKIPDKSKRVIYLADKIWASQSTSSRPMSQNDIGSEVKYNNNINNKMNNNINSDNNPMTFDKDGTMYWHGKKCEATP